MPLASEIEDGTAPALDNGFAAALRAGHIEIVPEIERFEGRAVHLVDGRVLEPDTTVCGTGYRAGLEPLVGHLGVLGERGAPAFSGDRASTSAPGLWFLGFANHLLAGSIAERRREARALARRIARGGAPRPADLRAEIRRRLSIAGRRIAGRRWGPSYAA